MDWMVAIGMLTAKLVRSMGTQKVETLRATYGDDFLNDWRADAHLETVRQETGMSLSELARQHQSRK